MTSPKAVNMIAKVLVFSLLTLPAFAAKDSIQIEVKEAVSVTMTQHSATSELFSAQKDERQIQSFDLKAVINGQHVILSCRQLSKAFAVESACESIAPGIYNGELSHGKLITLHYNAPLSNKESKQNYVVQGSW